MPDAVTIVSSVVDTFAIDLCLTLVRARRPFDSGLISLSTFFGALCFLCALGQPCPLTFNLCIVRPHLARHTKETA